MCVLTNPSVVTWPTFPTCITYFQRVGRVWAWTLCSRLRRHGRLCRGRRPGWFYPFTGKCILKATVNFSFRSATKGCCYSFAYAFILFIKCRRTCVGLQLAPSRRSRRIGKLVFPGQNTATTMLYRYGTFRSYLTRHSGSDRSGSPATRRKVAQNIENDNSQHT